MQALSVFSLSWVILPSRVTWVTGATLATAHFPARCCCLLVPAFPFLPPP